MVLERCIRNVNTEYSFEKFTFSAELELLLLPSTAFGSHRYIRETRRLAVA